MTVIELMTRDPVEATVVYIVADTPLTVPFKKDGIEVWFNVAKLASPGVGNIITELPPGSKDKGAVRSTTSHVWCRERGSDVRCGKR